MIQIKDAVEIAHSNLQSLVPLASAVLLEEVELEEGSWNITLSYPDPFAPSFLGQAAPRKYKIFVIDAENGNFKAMKIRNA